MAEAEPWAARWQEMGYRVALWRDSPDLDWEALRSANFVGRHLKYPGYAKAVNVLASWVLANHLDCNFIIAAGDDIYPDPHKRAEEIELETMLYFGAAAFGQQTTVGGTCGVMQPTGDRWGEDAASIRRYGPDRAAYIDRVAGSAWIGREFIKRTYGGAGPLWPGYFHMFVDEELQAVAERLGVFWQRRDLTQRHNHCKREDIPGAGHGTVPEFLERAYSQGHWNEAKMLFDERKSAGFPGAFPT